MDEAPESWSRWLDPVFQEAIKPVNCSHRESLPEHDAT